VTLLKWLAVTIGGFLALALAGALGDLVKDEIRGWLERLPNAILCLAARRLPAKIGQQTLVEWRNELFGIRQDIEDRPLYRLWIGLKFASGLLYAGRRSATRGARKESSRRRGSRAQLWSRMSPIHRYGIIGLGLSGGAGFLVGTGVVAVAAFVSFDAAVTFFAVAFPTVLIMSLAFVALGVVKTIKSGPIVVGLVDLDGETCSNSCHLGIPCTCGDQRTDLKEN
jgi:hypothetical protein